MTFLNGLLALGSLAFTIPLVIHLFFRSRFRTVSWGAMHLLDEVVRVNRRRIEWMNLLLLLLRCLIPILLAFCLARPVLTGFRALPGESPQSLIIAMDDSRSMAHVDGNGMTRMQFAKRSLDQLLRSYSRRDEVMLVLSSRLGEITGTMGVSQARKEIATLEPNAGPVDLGRLVRQATLAAENASNPIRRLLVVSDFQSHMVDDQALQTLRQLGRDEVAPGVDRSTSFLNVARPNDSALVAGNVSVESITVESAAVVAGRDASFAAKVQNHGDVDVTDLSFAWSVDGNVQRPQTVSVSARSVATVRLSHQIDQVGIHQVSVAVERADPLVADNERAIGIDVIREVRTLLVDGQPSARPLGGRADFLALALSPFSFEGENQPDAVRTRVEDEFRAVQAIDEEAFDVIILAGIKNPREELRTRVADHVIAGGHVVIFDHPQLDRSAYQAIWRGSGRGNQDQESGVLLPAVLGEFQDGGTSVPPIRWSIGRRHANYPAWDVLGNDQDAGLSEVEISQYRQFTLRDPTPPANEPVDQEPSHRREHMTLLSLADGAPLAVLSRDQSTESRQGAIVQWAIAADLSTSTLPVRTVFLPLMQQMVLDLAGNQTIATLDVGQTILLDSKTLHGTGVTVPPKERVRQNDGDSVVVTKPDGTQRTVKIPLSPEAATASLAFSDTRSPGTYRFRLPGENQKPNSERQTIRVVEVPAIESSNRLVDSDRLAAAASTIDATILQNAQEMTEEDQVRRFGREIWRWLLVGLLAVMLLELWLQQRLGGTTSKSLSVGGVT